MTTKEFIVAIELGSSKVVGVAGKKNIDGSISVLHSVREESSSFIRKGIVRNIDKTAQCISNIVQRLANHLKTEISQVYVGVGGQSIYSVRNSIVKTLPADTKVTQEMINELMDANRNMVYQDREILDAATQEYKLDNQEALEPVGEQCTRLEGRFLNILWRKTFYRNLNKCFEQAGVNIAEMYLAPLALADSVLTDAERRSGCVLVDLGADTTTVSVYYRNILRHLVVIPLGCSNITKDIASLLQMDDVDAENMKLKYGSAYTENSEIDDKLMFSIDEERSVSSLKFIDVVEARLQEIIKNVSEQIPQEYATRLLGGVILTGGGANMKNIEKAFKMHSGIDKVRVAKFVTLSITAKDLNITSKNAMMNTVLGLLAKGDMNCAGLPQNPDAGLFDEATPVVDNEREPRRTNELEPGVVQTEGEKRKLEEQKRREEEERLAEEERLRREEEERQQREKESKWKRFVRYLKGFVAEDE